MKIKKCLPVWDTAHNPQPIRVLLENRNTETCCSSLRYKIWPVTVRGRIFEVLENKLLKYTSGFKSDPTAGQTKLHYYVMTRAMPVALIKESETANICSNNGGYGKLIQDSLYNSWKNNTGMDGRIILKTFYSNSVWICGLYSAAWLWGKVPKFYKHDSILYFTKSG